LNTKTFIKGTHQFLETAQLGKFFSEESLKFRISSREFCHDPDRVGLKTTSDNASTNKCCGHP
jgi:hypothetical protein